jgi:hypothetical protein
LIEKSMASPSVLAMLLTTKYVDGLPLHRVEKVLGRHGVDTPRQTLARWVIQCGEHLPPLLNLMRDRLLESRVIHCDETRVQVMKELDREPTSQSWMWVQSGGPPNQPVHGAHTLNLGFMARLQCCALTDNVKLSAPRIGTHH